MKKFIIKLAVFSAIAIGIILLLLERYKGTVDYFYTKFTTPKQHSIIVGDSRSFQGIQPSVINSELHGDFELPMYNYSFTIAQIAFGDALLESIKRKVDPNTKNGLFILSVHPWVLSERDYDDIKAGKFFEVDGPPHNMTYVDMNPNPEYFFRNYNFFHFKAVFRSASIVHEDGWLEEPTIAKDPKKQEIWIPALEKYSKAWKKSDYRLNGLEKTIAYLEKHGTVVLVRMPNSAKIVSIEETYWPGFDNQLRIIAKKNNVRYFTYSNSGNAFWTYDGVHLDKFEGARFSKSLCDSIKLR